MGRSLCLGISLVAWVGVWAFWLAATSDFHPLPALALVVTTSLVVAYAAAAYINHLILLPQIWEAGRRWRYAAWLAATMAVLTAAALAVVAIGTTWYLWPEPAIGPTNFQRIEPGMTQAEIEAIIGIEAHSYHWSISPTRLGPLRRQMGKWEGVTMDYLYPQWWGDRYAIWVLFDADGKATCADLFEVEPSDRRPGILDRIRSWLGW